MSAPLPASTPLHDAADSGDIPTVTGLLQNGADANARAECPGYDDGATPLHLAARGGHLPAVLALLGAGATPHGRDADSRDDDETGNREEGGGDLTPLHEACARGHVSVVKALLDAGEHTDWIAAGRTVEFNDSLMAFSGTRDGGHTPLHLAAAHGHVEVVRALIDTGAPVNIQVDCDDTPLHLAAAGGHVDVMAALLDAGADVDAGDHVGNTALHAVGDVASLEFLLAAGANPNLVAASKYGSGTPLGSHCTLIHRLETNEKDMDNATAQVEVLLRHGADTSIHASNAFPRAISPILSCAAKNGVPGIVSALLSAGLDPNERDKQGWTSLHDAAQGDHLEALRLLLRAGADVNAPTDRGKWTPLHLACRYTSPDCVLELLRWGADPDARTGVDSDDDAWRSDVVFGEGGTGVSRGCGKVPAEVIGLKNYAAPPAIGGTGPAADPSLDEDEQMEVFDEETGEQDMSALDRNAIRRALRREAAWRRRRGVMLLQASLDAHYDIETTPLLKQILLLETPAVAPAFSANRGGNRYMADGIESTGTDSGTDSGAILVGAGTRRESRNFRGKNKRRRRCLNAGGCAKTTATVGGRVGDREDDDNESSSMLRSVLEGVMDLAAVEKALLRQIVLFL